MKACRFCGDPVPDERPYAHCTKAECVTTWRHERRANMRIDLVAKQGFTYSFKDAPATPGRASGK